MDGGEKMWSIVRHMLGLYANMPGGTFASTVAVSPWLTLARPTCTGAKNWKKHLTERHTKATTPLRPDVLLEALELTQHAALSSLPLAWQAQSAATASVHHSS
jgi:hypothetical protein